MARLSQCLSLVSLAVLLLLGLVHADADFKDVRVHLTRDRSGKGGDKKTKYFRECFRCGF